MPYCASVAPVPQGFSHTDGGLDWFFRSIALPAAQYNYQGWAGLYLWPSPAGLEACPAYTNFVVVTLAEYDALRELTVINQTLKDELALTRAYDANNTNSINSNTTFLKAAVNDQGTLLQAKMDFMEGVFVVGVIVLALILGLFFGWKAVGRGAGRSG